MVRLNAFLGLFSAQALLQPPAPPASPTHLSEGHDNHGAVASESAVCSQVGISLLRAGGNAADAMVGTTLCVGVVAMYHSGIGGGGFALIRHPNGTITDLSFRETAPAAAYEDMFTSNPRASLLGGLASGVPGELRGLEHLHTHHGSLPWRALVAPAVRLARDGFAVTPDLVAKMDEAVAQVGFDFLTSDPSWAVDFAPNGTRVGVGDVMTRRRYADTLEVIGEGGVGVFYEGEMAEAMVRALRRENGTMTVGDLRGYRVVVRGDGEGEGEGEGREEEEGGGGGLVKIRYRGREITACGAPASGPVVLSAMKILEGYDAAGDSESVNLTTHRLDEAIRFAYGQRATLGDPAFVKGVEAWERAMVSEELAREVRGRISDERTQNVSAYDPGGVESLETHGTSQIVTADRSGLTISLTTTVNLLFGSALVVPETGVIMNNEMNDFSIPGSSDAFGYLPNPSNFIRPGKRPLSSCAPVIVTSLSDDEQEEDESSLYFVTGSAGGSRIITAVIQNLWHVLDMGLTLPDALARPRFHDQLIPNTAVFEYGYDNGTTAFMRERGHNVTFMAEGRSTANGVVRLENGTFVAGGEPRQVASGGFAV